MSMRTYYRLDRAWPAGALVPFERHHEVDFYDCDICSLEIGEYQEPRAEIKLGIWLAGNHAERTFSAHPGCLAQLPDGLLAGLAELNPTVALALADSVAVGLAQEQAP